MNREKITTLPLKELHQRLSSGETTVASLTETAIEASAAAFAANAYIDWQPELIRQEALRLDAIGNHSHSGLLGLPVSVKDIFDWRTRPTTCASRFFARTREIPQTDAGYVSLWRQAGALLAGKTNLNEFAYGITGENLTYGDCSIPGLPQFLTGGSSSGAAASVVAGSACLALGTDTGGSLRVPAALCGLISYRQSLGFGPMDGVFPLAHSFDTVGWLQRHLGDVAWVAKHLFPGKSIAPLDGPPRVTILTGDWCQGVEPEILGAQSQLVHQLEQAGAHVTTKEAFGFERAVELFVPIQARDAFNAHQPYWSEFSPEYDPAVHARIAFGERVDSKTYQDLQAQRTEWVSQVFSSLWSSADFLLAPACPVTRLRVGVDHSATRPRLLRLTAPASLAGLPVLTTPLSFPGNGIGFQWMARHGDDSRLWALADWLADRKVVF